MKWPCDQQASEFVQELEKANHRFTEESKVVHGPDVIQRGNAVSFLSNFLSGGEVISSVQFIYQNLIFKHLALCWVAKILNAINKLID